MASDRRILPGFSLSLGYTVFYLSLLVLIPLAALLLKASSLSASQFADAVWTERARAAYALTFGAALAAGCAGAGAASALAACFARGAGAGGATSASPSRS